MIQLSVKSNANVVLWRNYCSMVPTWAVQKHLLWMSNQVKELHDSDCKSIWS